MRLVLVCIFNIIILNLTSRDYFALFFSHCIKCFDLKLLAFRKVWQLCPVHLLDFYQKASNHPSPYQLCLTVNIHLYQLIVGKEAKTVFESCPYCHGLPNILPLEKLAAKIWECLWGMVDGMWQYCELQQQIKLEVSILFMTVCPRNQLSVGLPNSF